MTATAICEWQTRMPQIGEWRPYDRSKCRAMIAEKIVTVWLPKGAKIRFRRAKAGYDGARWFHPLGNDREARILVSVPAARRVVDHA